LLCFLFSPPTAFNFPFRISEKSRSLYQKRSPALKLSTGYDSVIYGPDSFGDIIFSKKTDISFLRGAFSPVERIVLTANGNLQRILSAYYGSDPGPL